MSRRWSELASEVADHIIANKGEVVDPEIEIEDEYGAPYKITGFESVNGVITIIIDQ